MPATAPGELLLAKTLRDGRHIEILLLPESGNPDSLSYALSVRWPGQAGRQFSSRPYKPETAPAPGVTHAISVPGPDGKWVSLGLTAAEAAAITDGTSAWVQARKDRAEAAAAEIAAAARNAAPGARTWTVRDAYGHLAGIGQAVRLGDGTAVTALSHSSVHYKEDGFSFGAAEDEGWVYLTEVREATPAEAAALEASEAREAARQALAEEGAALASAAAETPADAGDLRDLPGARIEPARPLTLAFGTEGCHRHLRLDEPAGWLWALTWNGADGDDWSLSNSGPYIARRLPLTPERRGLFAALAAEFGAITARNG
jgi:hypothetical protein